MPQEGREERDRPPTSEEIEDEQALVLPQREALSVVDVPVAFPPASRAPVLGYDDPMTDEDPS